MSFFTVQHHPVEIDHRAYFFTNQLDADPALLASFNRLALETFDLSFEQVGGDYVPHVLVHGGEVCANVSVNRMPFYLDGQRKLYVQLGTVMTAPSMRCKGLSRWLLQWVLDAYLPQCDALYLFANDSVLEFYPKYGFVAQAETEFSLNATKFSPVPHPCTLRKLHAAQDEARLLAAYRAGNPYAAFSLVENLALPAFYWGTALPECFYLLEPYDMVVVAETEGSTVLCHEIWGEGRAPLREILSALCTADTQEVTLGFTPLQTDGLTARRHKESGITLFVHQGGENPMVPGGRRFPTLSHA